MDKTALLEHLRQLDAAMQSSARLCVFGSGALILLGEPGRTSLDLDVAASYSQVALPELEQSAAAVHFPVNPPPEFEGDHIEWIGPLRLCLAPPQTTKTVPLWSGRRLEVFTVAPADLAASKLVRYDELDRADIQFLCEQTVLGWDDIAEAAQRLPNPFRNDPVVRDNLNSLKTDMSLWKR
jgi:hypothetical protein